MECQAVVIIVPLFVDSAGLPDFGWMDSAAEAVAQALTPDTLVVYENDPPCRYDRAAFFCRCWKRVRPPRQLEISSLRSARSGYLPVESSQT